MSTPWKRALLFYALSWLLLLPIRALYHIIRG